jgi:hypothetical protein
MYVQKIKGEGNTSNMKVRWDGGIGGMKESRRGGERMGE